MPTATVIAWDTFRHRLVGYVGQRVENRADAEDLVQEVLARVAHRLPELRSSDRLLPWLFRITRNAIVDYYRRRGRAREQVPLEAAVDLPETAIEPGAGEEEPTAAARSSLARCVRPMLQTLPPLYREAVARVDLDGARQVDVARELGLGISTLKSRVQRGRAMLLQSFVTCCHITRDGTGAVMEVERKAGGCGSCNGSPMDEC